MTPTKATTLLLVLVACWIPAHLALADDLALDVPAGTHLTGADFTADGAAVVAFEANDDRWSVVRVVQAGQVLGEWRFEGLFVKQVRWARPHQEFVALVVTAEGPEERVYSVSPKTEPRLEWSSRELRRNYDNVSLTQLGRHWIGASFSADAAKVAVGKVGDDEPLWSWALDAESHGRPGPFALAEISYVLSWERPQGVPDVGILWGARLWLARPFSEHMVRISPPEGCPEVYGATATDQGLWIECDGGTPAEPAHLWVYYAMGFDPTLEERSPSLVRQFREPRFLADGTVLDLYRHEGMAGVYDTVGEGLDYLGDLEYSAGARVQNAGGVLLIEDSPRSAVRALPLAGRLAELRAKRKSDD